MKAMYSIFVLASVVLSAMTLISDPDTITNAPTGVRTAPEWSVSDRWINSQPLRLADLRGKIVLVDFWTYSCINCLRTIPYLNRWYQTYKDRGLVVVGIHSPEFDFEHTRPNVEDAVKRFDIRFPVAQDNDFVTWKRFGNIAWPAFYLIDRQGRIVITQYGEGAYDRMENTILQLLGADVRVSRDDGADLSRIRTPEIHFGTLYEGFRASQQLRPPGSWMYQLPATLNSDEFALGGQWSLTPQKATLDADGGVIILRFSAAKVHLVAGAGGPTELTVSVDSTAPRRIVVEHPELYTLFDSEDYREHMIRIEVRPRGFVAYSFTFG